MNNFQGILFAVLSMIFVGIVDFAFKSYFRRSGQAMGNFLAGVGFVWTVFFALGIVLKGQIIWQAWPIALASGLVSITANVFLAVALRRLDGGVCSTVYRLNLVLVVFLAAIFLGETITLPKLIAVGLGVTAVIFMFQRSPGQTKSTGSGWAMFMPFFWLITASAFRAVMGLLYKLANEHGVGKLEFLTINGLCWLAGGLILGLCLGEPLVPTRRGWRYAIIAGLLVCGDVAFLLLATAYGEASVVVPISQLGFAVAVLLGWVFLKEKLSARRIMAIICAVLCIFVMLRA